MSKPGEALMRTLCIIVSSLLIWMNIGCQNGSSPQSPNGLDVFHAAGPEILLEKGDLKVLFKDNSESPRVLSGLQSLFNTRSAVDFDAFDPDTPGASAGLNFEHIISGHENQNNKFTPRKGKYSLCRLADGSSVALVRDAYDCPWQISSTMTYIVKKPHYIDFEFKCTPYNAELFGSRGYAIFFFANYMNNVTDVAMHFRGIEGLGSKESWIAADAPKGPPHYDGGGTYRHADALELRYDQDLQFNLNSWSYDWPRFTKPFYYGNAANDMVFLLMFDTSCTEYDEIRFSLFKFKLDKFPRPAWDFQYVIHRVENEKEYGFRGRLVWKRFISEEDCYHEYLTWTAGLGK